MDSFKHEVYDNHMEHVGKMQTLTLQDAKNICLRVFTILLKWEKHKKDGECTYDVILWRDFK